MRDYILARINFKMETSILVAVVGGLALACLFLYRLVLAKRQKSRLATQVRTRYIIILMKKML